MIAQVVLSSCCIVLLYACAISTIANRDGSVVRGEPHRLLLRLVSVACTLVAEFVEIGPRC